MKQHVKKNDLVYVLTGKDRGKKGVVLSVLPSERKVKVKGVALVTRHYKARKQGEKSGIKKVERYIDISNVVIAK
jgi:large subunit ribosomal protein L24